MSPATTLPTIGVMHDRALRFDHGYEGLNIRGQSCQTHDRLGGPISTMSFTAHAQAASDARLPVEIVSPALGVSGIPCGL
jgi:hypothetical protein